MEPTENPPTGGMPEPEKPPREKWNLQVISDYAKNHGNEIAAYVLLTLGIFLLFFYPFLGEILVGVVFGSYFTSQILDIAFNYDPYSHQLGIAHTLILAGTVLALFIMAPLLFIAAGVTAAVKYFLVQSSTEK